jgi:hypothetical protein
MEGDYMGAGRRAVLKCHLKEISNAIILFSEDSWGDLL